MSIKLVAIIFTGATVALAGAQDVMTRDTQLACEAVLCLATGAQPTECAPSLRRYFGISYRSVSDTIRGRAKFLKQCPLENGTPQMEALVNAQANGAGRCDARSVNATLMKSGDDSGTTYISNKMPEYCVAYFGHSYTDLIGTAPRYVGLPERGGFWADAAVFNRALADYNERVRREDEESRSRSRMN